MYSIGANVLNIMNEHLIVVQHRINYKHKMCMGTYICHSTFANLHNLNTRMTYLGNVAILVQMLICQSIFHSHERPKSNRSIN
jgi:hypothetical protein